MERIALTVKGMTCEHCVMTVTKSLKDVHGVRAADVNLENEVARITFDPAQVGIDDLVTAIKDAGYEVNP